MNKPNLNSTFPSRARKMPRRPDLPPERRGELHASFQKLLQKIHELQSTVTPVAGVDAAPTNKDR